MSDELKGPVLAFSRAFKHDFIVNLQQTQFDHFCALRIFARAPGPRRKADLAPAAQQAACMPDARVVALESSVQRDDCRSVGTLV